MFHLLAQFNQNKIWLSGVDLLGRLKLDEKADLTDVNQYLRTGRKWVKVANYMPHELTRRKLLLWVAFVGGL